MDLDTKILSISKETVESISKRNNEPEWLLKKRLSAYEIFQATPNLTSRRMDYKNLDLDNYHLNLDGIGIDGKSERDHKVQDPSNFDFDIPEENSIVHIDDRKDFVHLSGSYNSLGILLTTVKDILDSNSELFHKYFGNADSEDSLSKLSSLTSALWQNGTFIYVPKNVRIELPLYNIQVISGGSKIYLPLTFIVVDSGAELTLVDYQKSDSPEMNALVSNSVNLVACQGARVNYISIQAYGNSVNHFSTKYVNLKRDSAINWIEIALGSKFTKNHLVANLSEPGSEAIIGGMFLARGNQQMEFNTNQIHIAPNAKSDLLFIGALRDKAHSSYEGKIRVHHGAQKTDAYQKNSNLLLSKEARADSEPFLEIEANDVRCTHGATVGPIGKEDLFYLMSRGIPREPAIKLLVLGFFNKVIGRIPVEKIREKLESYIQNSAIV
jgi:Fe-S cluster assembly protein SufD